MGKIKLQENKIVIPFHSKLRKQIHIYRRKVFPESFNPQTRMLTLAFTIEYGSQGLISTKVREGLVLKVTTAPEQSVD